MKKSVSTSTIRSTKLRRSNIPPRSGPPKHPQSGELGLVTSSADASPKRPASTRRLPPPTESEAAFERLLATFGSSCDVASAGSTAAPEFALGGPTAIANDGPGDGEEHSDDSVEGGEYSDDSASGEEQRGDAGDGEARSDDCGGDAAVEDATVAADRAALAELFAKRDAYLTRDRFASIGEAESFFTKIVGVSFEGRQHVIAGLAPGDALALVREPHNVHDPNAIAVRFGTLPLGYLRREIAQRLAPNIDGGDRYEAAIGSITGGGARNVGVNIHVRRERRAPVPSHAEQRAGTERARGASAEADIRHALIGERPLRDAQQRVFERLHAGRRTLAVLGTGRGKSLCFQLPAARAALERGAKTLVFYPLRALANDQYEALVRRLEPLGLRILRANGSIDASERERLADALLDGSWDLILTTPEFASFHREEFLRPQNRPEFVVVDEAHHLFEARHRPAYGSLGAYVRELEPQRVLALTATANASAFGEIRAALGIDAWVIDPTVRDNLHVVDARNTGDRTHYLARELEGTGKAIVYGNSRSEVCALAERLRARFGPVVAFYHAGIPAPERAIVEDLFRRGSVRIVVATSAFGEGIDLPDVRDVVLYHLNFAFTEFNQMAGRAGRDNADARIHLLYGESDRRINDFLIARTAPSLTVLRHLYRGLRGLGSDGVLRLNYDDAARTLALEMADGSTVKTAVDIFEEAGLVTTGRDDDGLFVRFLPVDGKVDLTATARYAEGQAERENFERFCSLALTADAETLEQIINRPIYPDRTPLSR